MRAAPLGPSVELPMGPRNDVPGGGDACGLHHWDLRWSSLWGHETCDVQKHTMKCRFPGILCVKLAWRRTKPYASVSTAILNIFFGGAPYGGTKRARGVPKWGCRPHAGGATGAFGGAPLWGHETREGCAETGCRQHAGGATGALGGAPYVATKRAMGPRNV